MFNSLWTSDFCFNMILQKGMSLFTFKIYLMLWNRMKGTPMSLIDYLRHSTVSFLKVTIISVSFHARIFPYSSYFVSHILNFKGGNGTIPANCETTVWLIILAFLYPYPIFLCLFSRKTWRIILKWWHPTPEDQLHSHLIKPCLGEEVGRQGRVLKGDWSRFNH